MITALIPARGGSKGIPKKNIVELDGYPLIAYSIAVALKCPSIDRVIVSTDDEEIAEVAKRFGAEVPFMRPNCFAGDDSPDLDFMHHFLNWAEKENVVPEFIVHLRPTTPLRNVKVIEEAIVFMQARKRARVDLAVDYPEANWFTNETALRSIHELREPPEKLFRTDRHGWLETFMSDRDIGFVQKEYYNLPRQSFRPAYQPNGYVDIIKPETLKAGSLHGKNMWGFETPNTGEVDTQEDLEFIEFMLQRHKFDSRELLRSYK